YLDGLYPSNQIPPTAYGGAASDPCLYFNLSGTSMATPTVAGTAALMLQKDPTATVATIKSRLIKTSEKVTYFGDIYGRGFGYLKIGDALACTDVATSALSPQCILNPDGTVSINSVSYPLSSSVWSLLICLGVNAAWGENNCGGESAMWSSNGLTGENFAAG